MKKEIFQTDIIACIHQLIFFTATVNSVTELLTIILLN